jgi:acetyl esterase/lipase
LHDEGGQQPVAQLIFAPMLDDRTALREDLTAEKHFIWNNKNNRGGWQSYLGQEPGLPEVPQYSVPARRESLVGLPQAWLGIGDIDLFYEESVAYAERLEADGVPCELFITEGGPHACETMLPQSSPGQAWWNSVFAFLRRVLE